MRTIYSCTIRGLAMAYLMLFGVFAMSQTPKAKFSIQPVLGTDNFTFIDESDGAFTDCSFLFQEVK